jgi:capsular exopolysaccharide synthesis family protein
LHEQEAELRQNQAELQSKYGPLHPKIINTQAQIRDMQAKIAEEVHKIILGMANDVEVAKAKENTLEQELSKQEDRAGVEMKDSVTLRQLQRESDANRSLYETFLGRFKETAEAQDLQIPDSRIIARADTPIDPSFPKKFMFMLVGAVMGGILGIVLAYMVEYFDRGFRSASQIEAAANVPVIGLVPDLRQITQRSPEDYVVDKPLSSFGEALRTVRTAIHFSNVDHPPKIVMITSATPGEGKTTFCMSLARTLAKTGNKILLIDADLRRSRVALATGITDINGGLSALLAGDKTLAEVVRPDPVVPGLDIIAATGKTPNSQDLLGSHQMQKMVHDAAKHYDLVIIDTPPVLAVSDSAMIARIADTSVFLVQWANVSQDLVLQALKQLKSYNVRIAGVVLSQVNLVEHAKYTDSYYHSNYNEYYSN